VGEIERAGEQVALADKQQMSRCRPAYARTAGHQRFSRRARRGGEVADQDAIIFGLLVGRDVKEVPAVR
jgi:hypothetical protein